MYFTRTSLRWKCTFKNKILVIPHACFLCAYSMYIVLSYHTLHFNAFLMILCIYINGKSNICCKNVPLSFIYRPLHHSKQKCLLDQCPLNIFVTAHFIYRAAHWMVETHSLKNVWYSALCTYLHFSYLSFLLWSILFISQPTKMLGPTVFKMLI